ncbi:DUF1499 domain-containing protein [Halomonas cerina]|uniref:Uncharacterized protein (DUF1499 family) n=1 Tax=Halomonas cerina TaxID=447424 RepID=A0A839V7C8_9GAMM|nr:DUF1499 domain-containing protein [Halomonas cerina]MBB3191352.1 uncharacterized protein (DUF1499 family) [Halomonas cerina]
MSTLRLTPGPRGGRWPLILVGLGVILLALAALLMGGAGPAYRWEWVSLSTSFSVLRQGAHLAVAAGGVGLLALIVAVFCRRWRPALAGALVMVAGVAMVAQPWQLMQRAQVVPPIHDITTDTQNPPAFEALAAAREAAPNAVAYPGEATARQQRAGYPRLGPITLEMPLDRAMAAAEATAREMGWEIAAVTERRLEATATTRWFGFKDDVAIRLTETGNGVRVDVRSASRVGRSDLGTNAARIQAYLEALAARGEGAR